MGLASLELKTKKLNYFWPKVHLGVLKTLFNLKTRVKRIP